MPQSAAQRRMSDGWSPLIRRASIAAQALPPEGVPRSEFVDSVLVDVQPGEVDAVLRALHARKIVWVGRQAGFVRVYREAPPAEMRMTSETTTPIGRFVAAVAPHFIGLADSERARAMAWREGDWKANDAAHDAIRANVHRILGICRAHASRGLSVEAIRNVLHGTFAEDALAALAYHEPRLQRGALDEDLDPPKSGKLKRAPKGLDLDGRLLRLIERAGDAGVTLTTLGRGIRPAMPSAAIREATDRLAASGLIVTRMVKPAGVGRPGGRCFRA